MGDHMQMLDETDNRKTIIESDHGHTERGKAGRCAEPRRQTSPKSTAISDRANFIFRHRRCRGNINRDLLDTAEGKDFYSCIAICLGYLFKPSLLLDLVMRKRRLKPHHMEILIHIDAVKFDDSHSVPRQRPDFQKDAMLHHVTTYNNKSQQIYADNSAFLFAKQSKALFRIRNRPYRAVRWLIPAMTRCRHRAALFGSLGLPSHQIGFARTRP